MGSDTVSQLPAGVVDHILSFLTTRDAVRTSVLSSNWRHRWSSATTLFFRDRDFKSLYNFHHFIASVLNLRDPSAVIETLEFHISKFRMCESDDASLVRNCILHAAKRGVKKLKVYYSFLQNRREINLFPSSLFSACESLESLSVDIRIMNFSTETLFGLRALRKLHLKSVSLIDGGQSANAISRLPSLEEFTIQNSVIITQAIQHDRRLKILKVENCYITTKLHISAPGLESLIIRHVAGDISLDIDLPSLVDAVVINNFGPPNRGSIVSHGDANILLALSNAQHLELHLPYIAFNKIGASKNLPTLYNLKHLKLHSIMNSQSTRDIILMLQNCSPNLESLVIQDIRKTQGHLILSLCCQNFR